MHAFSRMRPWICKHARKHTHMLGGIWLMDRYLIDANRGTITQRDKRAFTSLLACTDLELFFVCNKASPTAIATPIPEPSC